MGNKVGVSALFEAAQKAKEELDLLNKRQAMLDKQRELLVQRINIIANALLNWHIELSQKDPDRKSVSTET
jgi:hypothetical protein